MVYTDLCSFYFSVFDEHAVDMTLEEFVKLLRGEPVSYTHLTLPTICSV